MLRVALPPREEPTPEALDPRPMWQPRQLSPPLADNLPTAVGCVVSLRCIDWRAHPAVPEHNIPQTRIGQTSQWALRSEPVGLVRHATPGGNRIANDDTALLAMPAGPVQDCHGLVHVGGLTHTRRNFLFRHDDHRHIGLRSFRTAASNNQDRADQRGQHGDHHDRAPKTTRASNGYLNRCRP